jgi:hypothetical protein
MSSAWRLLNGIVAGVVAACLTGALFGLAQALFEIMTRWGHFGDIVLGTAWLVGMSTLFAGALGAIPGAIVMCTSRARYRPWHAMPLVLVGTSAGILFLSLPLLFVPVRFNIPYEWRLPIFAIGPMVGGIIATLFLPPVKLPRPAEQLT